MGKAACRSTYRYDSLAAEGSKFDEGRGRGPRAAVVVVASRERVGVVDRCPCSAPYSVFIHTPFGKRWLARWAEQANHDRNLFNGVCRTPLLNRARPTVCSRTKFHEDALRHHMERLSRGLGWARLAGHDGGRRCCLPASPRRPRHCLFRCLLPTCPHLVQI